MAKDEAKWSSWRKRIKDWEGSGLTRSVYCKREGVKPSRFDYWRALIVSQRSAPEGARRSVRGEDITLVPVKVVKPAVEVAGDWIELKSPTGWEIRVPKSVEARWLMDVLRELA